MRMRERPAMRGMGDRMAEPGRHVLIFDTIVRRRRIFEEIATDAGHWATLAQNLDEAMAVLRSALHPLIVFVNLQLKPDIGCDGSQLPDLLGNPDFAATHAFIITHSGLSEVRADIREQIEQSGASYVRWLRLPTVTANIGIVQEEAARYLATRG